MSEIIVFTSGKGGVGKTTAVANIGTELSLLDKKVVMLDADMGLRNLDVVMGLENRITYNLADVLENRCRVNQALIRDRRYPNLYIVPAAPNYTRLTQKAQEFRAFLSVLKSEFDFCLIDCPAGIEDGFQFAVSQADCAIIVTTPHISAVRDADRVRNLLESRRFLKIRLIVNQVNRRLLRKHNVLSTSDIEELLGMRAMGIIPLDDHVIISQNQGVPVNAYRSAAGRQFRLLSKRIFADSEDPLDIASEDPSSDRDHFLPDRKEVLYEIS